MLTLTFPPTHTHTQLIIRFYTYGTQIDTQLSSSMLSRLSDSEIEAGVSTGPDKPISQDDFDQHFNKGRRKQVPYKNNFNAQLNRGGRNSNSNYNRNRKRDREIDKLDKPAYQRYEGEDKKLWNDFKTKGDKGDDGGTKDSKEAKSGSGGDWDIFQTMTSNTDDNTKTTAASNDDAGGGAEQLSENAQEEEDKFFDQLMKDLDNDLI